MASNYHDITLLLEKYAVEILKSFTTKVEDVIKDFIELYYDEYDPIRYQRTHQFLNSVVRTGIEKNGNEFSCYVLIDTDSLDYKEATGQEVVTIINEGFHGNYDIPSSKNINFWDDSKDYIEWTNLYAKTLKEYFSKRGIKVI